ncbi:transcription factor TFIIIC complex subunit Tfc6, putative [Talaromyces stipitatus ATCC 10500]|uniref:Transcription factor TFIIIC complex subunit Tfc6, putative n=1 Tax=Talaromyces stipitatus (strain ATCC 10500 / CBS 375.48 / QM 6759 / NRRL 1006) TaxID=441959 RepID=B8M7K3_TALSN|nr:transcription factor TFIIIC complex subunit Tfc6, putative [Talaromyces stipitatus ATCC 10500]EED19556.1 transcription factor TFIIIC complex subunit Tfc6, putative [Talaromyces stipitatus ATCC 10500]
MPPRRSTRRGATRKSYTEDAFEAIGLEDDEGPGESTSPKEPPDKSRKRRRDESDDEFNEEDAAAASAEEEYLKEEDEEEEEEEADDDLKDEAAGDINGGGGADVTPAAKLSKLSIAGSRGSRTPTSNTARLRRDDGSTLFKPNDTHTRGAYNPSEHVGKSMHIKLSFGVDNRDLLAATAARTQWSLGIDATFPTRASLERVPSADEYGPGATHGISAEELEREATEAWDWYYDADHGSRFRKRQRVERIDRQRVEQKFLYKPRKTSHKIIYGPSENLATAHLRQYESLNFGDAWKYRDETHKTGNTVDATKKGKGRPKKVSEDLHSPRVIEAIEDESSGAQTGQRRKNRYGWILNLSGKVQALGWAPNQDGLTQYLAVSVPISPEQEMQHDPPEPPVASRAFSVSPPYPGAIQIWSFNTEERRDGIIKTVDINSRPKLQQVLCMEFGNIRKIRWCPFPRRQRDKDIDSRRHDLGLLACVFSDGRTRIIDVKVDRDAETTEYLQVNSAAFTAIPSPTISSCMAWLSPTDIAIGCANGWVAVYNIATYQTTPSSRGQEDEPVPYMYIPIHSTYITNIETAYPQHPHLISTVSMDGNTRLTSLLDPIKDVVDTQRQRLGTMQISYYPHFQAFVSSDENDFVRGLSIRRFYTSTAIGKVPSTITTIASGSRWHPSVMLGCTEGSIWCLNPLRRFMHAKESHFHARWFLHEWAAGKDDQTPNTSRFTDDLEVESLSLVRNAKEGTKIVNGVMTITIYDEEQHVVAVDWNPNQHCAGWAAAGMGSGLVRVEDLAMFH